MLKYKEAETYGQISSTTTNDPHTEISVKR
jgi:hypothetical protein